MNNWIILTILYAIFIAFHESANKKAVEKNSVYEVLAIFSTAAFLLVALFTKDAFTISYNNLLLVIIKSVIVLCAWICGLKSIKQIEISIYGMINISTIILGECETVLRTQYEIENKLGPYAFLNSMNSKKK